MPIISRTYDDYTIGWICALTEELVAARLMLDDIHPRLSQPPNDANAYILGSIGEHNVVITCLPEMGTNRAAVVATRMVSSFRNIKIGLMVGIGGGVPPKVSLGDIVISTPTDIYPGVIQHDFGKVEGGILKHTGALNKPPTILLTALKLVRAEHAIHKFNPHQHLQRLRDLYPDLESEYTHRPDFPEGLDVSQAEATSILERQRDALRIHYGLIVSGNQVIKDAEFRDALDGSLGGKVLCIEMEAAGLMDDFPCLVIRGICDYADSKKNDCWHKYAAMVAAAYTRDFLGHVRPIDVQREVPIETNITHATFTLPTHRDVTEVKPISEQKKVLRFLEGLTSIKHECQHRNISSRRRPGTGQWLIESSEYSNWLRQDKQILYCQGISGAGKSFLASRVIDHLSSWRHTRMPSITTGIAYLYCGYKREVQQTTFDTLVGLLIQLVGQNCPANARRKANYGHQSPLPEAVHDLYEKYRRDRSGTRPSISEIEWALESVMKTYLRVFIVVDALEECQTSNGYRKNLLRYLSEFRESHGVNMFVTSRHIPEIADHFKMTGSRTIEVRSHAEDIRRYLQTRIIKSKKKTLREHCQLIEDNIVEAIDGRLPLAQLYFESIEHKDSSTELKEELETLARGDAAYQIAYEKITNKLGAQSANFRQLSSRVLGWVLYAERPLTMLELQYAVAIKPEEHESEPDFNNCEIPEVDTIVSVCAGLITVDLRTNVADFIHATAREYFGEHWDFEESQIDITRACITYMSYNNFQKRPQENNKRFSERLRSDHFYPYVVEKWGHHARNSATDTAQAIAFCFLQNRVIVSTCGSMMLGRVVGDTGVTPLHIAAHFGLRGCVERLLQNNADLRARDWRSPLLLAAGNGHTSVVKLLLDHGSLIDFRGQGGDRPLSRAARMGQTEVVKLLLDMGAKVNDGADVVLSPLSNAARNGHIEVVDSLISAGAELNGVDSPLAFACLEGATAVVEVLLQAGANPDGYNSWLVPLYNAVRNGHTAIVELLIRYGADIRKFGGCSPSDKRRTALFAAVERGLTAMVELLIHHGADITVPDDEGRTPLMVAIERGEMAIVKLLLREGADINTTDIRGRTPLEIAAINKNVWAVEFLVRNSSDEMLPA